MSNVPAPAETGLELYIPEVLARKTIILAEQARLMVARAYLGESLGSLLGQRNEESRLVNMAGQCAIELTTLDRENSDQRRAEKMFRTWLLPAALRMVSKSFIFYMDAIEKPDSFSVLATANVPDTSRTIEIHRMMISVADPSGEVPEGKSLEYYSGMPGVVTYRMFVDDITRRDSPTTAEA